jgi:microcystin-dependent protein
MGSPYVGEIRLFAGNYAPTDWSFCDGALLSISENPTLFNLIGTTYGGNGTTTFALPDLRGRVPVHQGTGSTGTTYIIGAAAGTETVTLTPSQLPAHSHGLMVESSVPSGTGSSQASGHVLAGGTAVAFIAAAPDAVLAGNALDTQGGGQSHANVMPFQCMSYIISLFGIYPSQG